MVPFRNGTLVMVPSPDGTLLLWYHLRDGTLLLWYRVTVHCFYGTISRRYTTAFVPSCGGTLRHLNHFLILPCWSSTIFASLVPSLNGTLTVQWYAGTVAWRSSGTTVLQILVPATQTVVQQCYKSPVMAVQAEDIAVLQSPPSARGTGNGTCGTRSGTVGLQRPSECRRLRENVT